LRRKRRAEVTTWSTSGCSPISNVGCCHDGRNRCSCRITGTEC
jgi:hypothetical protein